MQAVFTDVANALTAWLQLRMTAAPSCPARPQPRSALQPLYRRSCI